MEATPRHRSPLRLARYDAPGVVGSSRPRDGERRGEGVARAEQALLLLAMHEDRGPVWVLSLAGEADLFTQQLLEDGLETAIAMRRKRLVLDVRRLTFCDVGCAQKVLDATRTVAAELVGATGEVQRVFELLDADETLPRRASSKRSS